MKVPHDATKSKTKIDLTRCDHVRSTLEGYLITITQLVSEVSELREVHQTHYEKSGHIRAHQGTSRHTRAHQGHTSTHEHTSRCNRDESMILQGTKRSI